MKRTVAIALVIALVALAAVAYADMPKLSDNMIKYAKNALTALESGAYDKLVTSLPFSGISPSANEWEKFAKGSFTQLSSVQTTYAVAYWTGNAWKIAVPLAEPSSDSVEVFVLSSEDGSSFSGYACTKWSSTYKECSGARYVVWDKEYSASTSAVIEADS